ncbi:AraC family transcriptional regulator [Streptomyces abyssalis]|uniref:AraC family transcriptional regulator n=1 Tax=Streptomyces abyssalis TaxID=933944 RepID=A0A1E7JJP5_9ACTN|nr:GyrI-like domain-containing protein [Streptomyces abyssalis]OEU87311.1 AraC family transcriptional regulator [Streptomyces abyssalis]OEU87842.1 AraC family transcriptional regulator [Streptomyces abyssalis]
MNSAASSQPGTDEPEIVDVEPAVTAVVRGVVPQAGLRDFFDTSFRQLGETVSRQQIAITGPAFGLYSRPPQETAELEVGFVTDRAVRPEGDVVVSALPGTRVARTTHHGSFDGLGASWERLHAWVREQGLTPGPVMWEFYVTEPTPDMDPRELRTQLNCVVADGEASAKD